MINLLPGDKKSSISYARRNTHLFHWAVALMSVMVVFAALLFAGQWYINKSTNNLAKQIEQTKAELEADKLSETTEQVKDISNNVKLIEQVLSKQVLFSKLITQVGAAMPEGAVLSNTELAGVDGGVNLSAEARNQTTATQIQINLQDKDNKIFDKVDIVSINCNSTGGGQYPCTVGLRASFAKDSPFLFINQDKED